MSWLRLAIFSYAFISQQTNPMVQSPSWEASQEISCLLWNLKVHYHGHKSHPLDPIPKQTDSCRTWGFHSIEDSNHDSIKSNPYQHTYFFEVCFHTISSFMPMSPTWGRVPLGLPTTIWMHLLCILNVVPIHPSWFDHHNKSQLKVACKLWSSS